MKLFFTFVFIIVGVNAAPAPTKTPTTPSPEEEQVPEHEEVVENEPANTGLYYDQYLQKVVQLLESDEGFRKAMESASFDDIKSGKMSSELLNIPTNIRDELDALKREEMTRLRRIAHAKNEVEKGRRLSQPTHLREIAQHLDPDNQHSFEAKDLTNLIQAATKDLENYDEKRHQEFKRYEMNKELRRQEKLRQMTEEDRKRAEADYQESRKRHEEHEAMNHPGSKAQLEEVWEEEDGLKGQAFNPKTFFNMHDLNSDGYLDQMELEALFEKDLRKVYDEKNPDDDMEEMRAERMRMREHVMKEVDTDRDGLISMQEFVTYSQTQNFEKPDENSYKTVDELIDNKDVFSDDEFQEFKDYIKEQEEELRTKLATLRDKARSVGAKKSDLTSNVKNLKQQNIAVENHPGIEQQKQEIAVEEEEMKKMHEELRKQSKEIMELKKEVQKQEQQKNPTPAPTKIPVEELHRKYEEKLAQQRGERPGQPIDSQQQYQGQQVQGLDPAQQAQLNAEQQQQAQQDQLNLQQQDQLNAQQQQDQLNAQQQQAQLNVQQQQQAQLNVQQQQQAQLNAQQQQAQLNAQQQAQLNAQQQQQPQH